MKKELIAACGAEVSVDSESVEGWASGFVKCVQGTVEVPKVVDNSAELAEKVAECEKLAKEVAEAKEAEEALKGKLETADQAASESEGKYNACNQKLQGMVSREF